MSMDAVVDERTLRELYLTGFEIEVKEGRPKAIMSSYNMVNGTYANENRHLLTDILRNEWSFDGFVATDWGADNDHVEGVRAGSNLVMPAPGPDTALQLLDALREDRITEEEIDCRLRELLRTAFSIEAALTSAPKTYNTEAHHALARKCAAESIVLLDNDGILPLKPGASVAVIGGFAQTPRYQGAGSSLVVPTKLDCFYDHIVSSGLKLTGFAPGYHRSTAKTDPDLLREAAALAAKSDVVLLCVGLDETTESEGMDRQSLALSPGQQALIQTVAEANQNLILVLSGGAPFLMPDRTLYRAAIHGYLGGQAGGCAMADAILGKTNPCGKLSETWPLRLEDVPSHPYFPSRERTSEYREGLYVGYRFYDTTDTPVRYPFGHGLSYTSFEYADLQASGHEVTFTLTNTGTVDGAEIAQLYVSLADSKVFRPKKELKGFAKVFLKAGERKTVTIPLDDKAFRYFNVKTNAWEVEGGTYTLSVASSVSDVRLTQAVFIPGSGAPQPYEALPSYQSGRIMNVPDREFEALLGRPIPDGSWGSRFSVNHPLCQLRQVRRFPARLLYWILNTRKEKGERKCPPDLNLLFIYNMPFRGISKLTKGAVSRKMTEDIVLAVTGHFFRGSGRLLVDFFKNARSNRSFLKKLEQRK